MDFNQESNDTRSVNDQFVRLWMENERRLYAFVLTLVPSWHAAEDLVQETVKEMWRKYAQSSQPEYFCARLLQIARYKIFNYYRQQRHEVCMSQDLLDDLGERAESLAAHTDERINALLQCLKKLPVKQKALIKMRYEEGISIKELSSVIEQSKWNLY
ncbi:MAG: sigma-70 family RNA polymerase sigma factor, partial [Sedimentisphaerales bacterium]|nr:sigma-70 family RNA polymerase sigma factor [Sedimentisphaerales bacterium]